MAKQKSVADSAADPTIEFAELEIDGQVYKLAYDFNAIAEAEKLAGCNLLHGIASVMLNGMSASQLRGLLYAAMRKAHPKKTIEDAGHLVRIDTMPDIRTALIIAYNNSLPEGKKILGGPTGAGEGDENSQTEKSGSSATPTPESTSDSAPVSSSA